MVYFVIHNFLIVSQHFLDWILVPLLPLKKKIKAKPKDTIGFNTKLEIILCQYLRNEKQEELLYCIYSEINSRWLKPGFFVWLSIVWMIPWCHSNVNTTVNTEIKEPLLFCLSPLSFTATGTTDEKM